MDFQPSQMCKGFANYFRSLFSQGNKSFVFFLCQLQPVCFLHFRFLEDLGNCSVLVKMHFMHLTLCILVFTLPVLKCNEIVCYDSVFSTFMIFN